jgi:hypothetical protein
MSPFLILLGLIPLLFIGSAVAAIFSESVRSEIKRQKWQYAVLGTISLVAVICLFVFHHRPPDLHKIKTVDQLNRIRAAILNYEATYSGPPATTDNAPLMRILERDNPQKTIFIVFNHGERNKQGEAIDAWGTPVRISLDDPANPQVQSAGPDKIWDTKDDISSGAAPSATLLPSP